MNRESQQSWWRELGAISRGLDFLQGGGSFEPSVNEPAQTTQSPRTAPAQRGIARLLHTLGYLGGRPMHAGHNDDLEEPFESPRPISRGAAACTHC